jgi:hypothetical protein
MKKSGFRLIVFCLAVCVFIPSITQAVIEEKSSIIGSLTGDSNSPLSGVSIRLLDSFFLDQIAATVTDAKGKFTISNLMPGLYLIALQSPSKTAIFKRVQVVSGAPTVIDIRTVLDEKEAANHDAWDKLKWTIRVAERNPLRDDQTITETSETEASQYSSDRFFAALKSFQQENNLTGQVSYMNVDSGAPTSTTSHQMTQFALQGGLESDSSWAVNGNILDGEHSGYIASGQIHQRVVDHHIGAIFAANDLMMAHAPDLADGQKIQRFVDGTQPETIAEESRLWIASLDLIDEWQLLHKVRVNYGTRIDYNGYLQNTVGYSPHFQATWNLSPDFALETLYYHNESAPGNYYLQPNDVHPYIHDIAFVPYTDSIEPEKTIGYEMGAHFTEGGLDLEVLYHSENVQNKIATVDLSGSPVNAQLQSIRPFVIFNATDVKTSGLEVRAHKKVGRLSTNVSYKVNGGVPVYIVEKRGFTGSQIFFMPGATSQQYHDLQAGVQADFEHTQTSVSADWNYSSGSPIVFGRKDSALASVDVEVHQGIPVHMFSQAQVKLLLAVKNLLDQNDDDSGNADFERALVYGMPRVIAGGVLVKF